MQKYTAGEIGAHLETILYGQDEGEFRVIITKTKTIEGKRYGSSVLLPENESTAKDIKKAAIYLTNRLDAITEKGEQENVEPSPIPTTKSIL